MQGPGVTGLSDLKLVRTYAYYDARNITAKHKIFEMYLGVTFEFFCGSELNSLDMVQAARIYKTKRFSDHAPLIMDYGYKLLR